MGSVQQDLKELNNYLNKIFLKEHEYQKLNKDDIFSIQGQQDISSSNTLLMVKQLKNTPSYLLNGINEKHIDVLKSTVQRIDRIYSSDEMFQLCNNFIKEQKEKNDSLNKDHYVFAMFPSHYDDDISKINILERFRNAVRETDGAKFKMIENKNEISDKRLVAVIPVKSLSYANPDLKLGLITSRKSDVFLPQSKRKGLFSKIQMEQIGLDYNKSIGEHIADEKINAAHSQINILTKDQFKENEIDKSKVLCL